MESEDLKLLSSSNKFQIIIESLVETVEMYNYDVRIFGMLDPDFFLPDILLTKKISCSVRLDLFEEGPADSTNGTCVFCDDLSQEDINAFLEVSTEERGRLTSLMKESLNRKESVKFFMELESIDDLESSKDIGSENMLEAISRRIINIKLVAETGTRRNYFS